MKALKVTAVGLMLLVLLLLLIYLLIGGRAGVVSIVFPKFPEMPAPQSSLDANASGEIYFASATPFDFDVLINGMQYAQPTTGMGYLFMPEPNANQGDKKLPAVILVHGSGGISPGREMEHGQMLAEQGYAALVINYYEPRGATSDVSYMLRVLSVTEFDALSDAYNALKLLRTHPLIDANKIAVAGYSYGGMAARFAMDDRVRQSLLGDQPGFAAHIDVYGPCFQKLNSPKLTGGPLLTLRGTDDNSNELPACVAREEEIRAMGTTVETHIYPGAGHAWDNHSERALREDAPYLSGCTMEYDSAGNSSVNGQDIVKVAIDTSRHERIATRLSSSGPLGECVGYGYIIGRDDDTRAKADAAVVAFLNKALR